MKFRERQSLEGAGVIGSYLVNKYVYKGTLKSDV